ncbi:MAG: tetratricopeptide repeat protein, partial [Gemmatimonadales bacterium]
SLADDSRPSIAVLPFADMSPQGDQEYFSDGMTEELLNTLAKIQQLRVAARTSTFAFKGTNLTAAQLGDTLHVRYFVEGSVRKAGDKLRITAQLIDTSTGSHLWSDTYDRTLDDVFAIQSEIAEAIADQLRVPLGLEGDESLVTPTGDLEAYDLYLAAKGRMRERGSGVAEAIRLFEAAIARDSSWAPAWAGLALSQATLPWYVTEVNRERPWAEHLTAGERAAERALALDSTSVTAWVALGTVHRERREWPEAQAAFQRALVLDPDDAEANQQYGEYLSYVGRIAESVDMARRGIELDRVPVRLNTVGYAEMLNGRYAEALAMFDAADRLDPTDAAGFIRRSRLRAYVSMPDWTAAREISSRYSGEGQENLRAAAAVWPPGSPPTPEVAERITAAYPDIGAVVWMALGRPDRAVAALGSAINADYGPTHYFWETALEPLLDDPEVQALMRRANLAGVRPQRTPR